jgi:biotin-dependent carboxylase-like uncharacterized protein
MSLRVIEPGLYTLVVDLGRPHCRSLGVAVGGAADRTALALGNALVGNPIDAAALEVSLAGPTLEADCELACVVQGAPYELKSNRQTPRIGTTFTLAPGEILRIGGTSRGMRAYLCVQGGLSMPTILGSRSGLAPIKAGAILPCAPGRIHSRSMRMDDRSAKDDMVSLRILRGPQAGWFGGADLTHAGSSFTVSPAANRMGLRLQGPSLPYPQREMVSEPVCPGTVQVTRDGQCIILGVDGQTIGGYPKIAQVIQADLDALGQLRPGERIRFQETTLPEAEAVYRAKQDWLGEWLTRLRTTRDGL